MNEIKKFENTIKRELADGFYERNHPEEELVLKKLFLAKLKKLEESSLIEVTNDVVKVGFKHEKSLQEIKKELENNPGFSLEKQSLYVFSHLGFSDKSLKNIFWNCVVEYKKEQHKGKKGVYYNNKTHIDNANDVVLFKKSVMNKCKKFFYGLNLTHKSIFQLNYKIHIDAAKVLSVINEQIGEVDKDLIKESIGQKEFKAPEPTIDKRKNML